MAKTNINQRLSQEKMTPKETRPAVTPKPQAEGPVSLSKRGELRVSDLSWQLRSGKDKIYRKYGISGSEVEEFANGLKTYDKSGGGFLRPSESIALEKQLRTGATSRGDVKSSKWLRILSDPEILKK